jgi:hypothetical protein
MAIGLNAPQRMSWRRKQPAPASPVLPARRTPRPKAGGLARLDTDGRWQTYHKANTNGGLPDDQVLALALGADGSLWAGTVGGGLARLEKDGRWQTYNKASTHGSLGDAPSTTRQRHPVHPERAPPDMRRNVESECDWPRRHPPHTASSGTRSALHPRSASFTTVAFVPSVSASLKMTSL